MGRLRRFFSNNAGRIPTPPVTPGSPVVPEKPRDREAEAVAAYIANGRVPFTHGYTEYKNDLLGRVFDDPMLTAAFRDGTSLPSGHGARLDERIVEYPWVLARLKSSPDSILVDAGGTFNKPFLYNLPSLMRRRFIFYTLETDWIELNSRLSYIFGDFREGLLRSGMSETVISISTLEHVGFTYDYKTYSIRNPWPHAKPESYIEAIQEFRRWLRPGGQLLLTVPYGTYENHGWLQQFDAGMVATVKAAFDGRCAAEVYYRYTPHGWQVSAPGECDQLQYFNIHAEASFPPDGAAAARAVVCLELVAS